MSSETKAKIKEIIIAAIVGAIITFLMKLLQGLTGLEIKETAKMMGATTTAALITLKQ